MLQLHVYRKPEIKLLASNTPKQGWTDAWPSDTWLTEGATGSDLLCEASGRVCYDSYENPRPGGNSAYLARIRDQHHGEVLEHAVFTILVRGVSRTLSHQLVRYRAGWSFCQRSSRFCDEAKQPCVVLPPAMLLLDPSSSAYLNWLASITTSYQAYTHLQEQLRAQGYTKKEVNEASRSLLPQCMATELVFTANARALRHFLEQRCSAHADAEIRRFANGVYGLLKQDAPQLFADYATDFVFPDGSFSLATLTTKV